MGRDRTNLEGLCDALNAVGIKTSIAGGVALERNLVYRALRDTEKARQRAAKEIDRIAGNAKRPTST